MAIEDLGEEEVIEATRHLADCIDVTCTKDVGDDQEHHLRGESGEVRWLCHGAGCGVVRLEM